MQIGIGKNYILRYLNILFSLIILLAVTLQIFFPFYGDQAFFNQVAFQMSKGQALYLDLWDLKQPGIFYFFLVAGKLFGFTDIGVHIFEVFYWISFVWIAVYLLHKLNIFPRNILILFPLFTVFLYYAKARPALLTQVEILVNFPILILILLSLFLKIKSSNTYIYSLLIGVISSLLLFFKLVFALYIISFGLFFFIRILLERQMVLKDILIKLITPFIIGLILLPVIQIIAFHKAGSLGLVYDTFFHLPYKIINEVNSKPPIDFILILIKSCAWFIGLIPLVLLGLFKNKHFNFDLKMGLVIWIFTSLIIIYLQKFSYWGYHFQLLIFPIGLLSLAGFDYILNIKKFPVYGSYFFLIIVLLPFLIRLFIQCSDFLNSSSIEDFKNGQNTAFNNAKNEAKQLMLDPDVKSIYVLGDPIYYYVLQKDQAVAINGWALELYTNEIFERLCDELRSDIPKYIFVANFYEALVENKFPILLPFLDKEYTLFRSSSEGKWYVHKSMTQSDLTTHIQCIRINDKETQKQKLVSFEN